MEHGDGAAAHLADEQGGAGPVGGAVDLAGGPQLAVEGAGEGATGGHGHEVLHGEHGGHASGEDPRGEADAGVAGAADGAAADHEDGEAELAGEALEHGGEAGGVDAVDAAVVLLEEEGELAVAAGDAVGDEVEDVEALLEGGLEVGEGAGSGEGGVLDEAGGGEGHGVGDRVGLVGAVDVDGGTLKVGTGGGLRVRWGETLVIRFDGAYSPTERTPEFYVDIGQGF